MKYLKRFNEDTDNSDIDEVLEILQYVGETKPINWVNSFVRFSEGIMVVYFKEQTQLPDSKEIDGCNHRLNQIGYTLISHDIDSVGLWFLVMSKETESKYREKLNFKFIEDLDFGERYFSPQDNKPSKYYNLDYPSGDNINIIQNSDKTWFVWDSITDNEEVSDNKVLANISLISVQHKVRGIQNSLHRRF